MSVKTLTEQILRKVSRINPWQRRFMLHLFSLWLAIRGRYNFTNLSRWGELGEDTYRQNFGRSFDWLAFNSTLVHEHLDSQRVIAFDPCFLPKSGKHTAGVDYFYSGCAGREQRGLEFCGMAAVDLSDKAALHLEAVQTAPAHKNRLAYYAGILCQRSEELLLVSRYVVVDAFFAREPFISPLKAKGYEVTTRLQKNQHVRYLYYGPKRKGKGRGKTYDGRIDPRNLRADYFTPCAKAEDGSWIAYHAVANVKSWKRNARLVIVHQLDQKGDIKTVNMYACTDTDIDGGEVLHMYGCRFQIEFLYRDAKQFAGLTHCQARSEEKLHFHLNTALTAVSLAKAAHHLDKPAEERGAFSMADIKTLYANELLLDQFIATFGNDLNPKEINSIRERLRNLGRIAA
jgi:hypothetical protein